MKMTKCIGCGAAFEDIAGPTHRYLESSPGCWAAYGEVLAREYSDPVAGQVHRLTVDAYAVQHPGRPSAQSIQSVAVHLMSLCLIIEHNYKMDDATKAIGRAVSSSEQFYWLEPPRPTGVVTVADVRKSTSVESHIEIVRKWAQAAWNAWTPHHDQIRSWLRRDNLAQNKPNQSSQPARKRG